MTIHRNLALEQVHSPISYEYADAAALSAATGFTAGDVGKIAHQLDTHGLWLLIDHDPITWGNQGGGAAPITMDEIVQAATDTLTAAECSGKLINNYGQAAENTQTLPAAAKGLHGIVHIATAGAGAFHLKAGAGDKIYLDGTALDDGDKVSLATPAVGDHFTFWAFQTGASAYDWIVTAGVGTLTDGGA